MGGRGVGAGQCVALPTPRCLIRCHAAQPTDSTTACWSTACAALSCLSGGAIETAQVIAELIQLTPGDA